MGGRGSSSGLAVISGGGAASGNADIFKAHSDDRWTNNTKFFRYEGKTDSITENVTAAVTATGMQYLSSLEALEAAVASKKGLTKGQTASLESFKKHVNDDYGHTIRALEKARNYSSFKRGHGDWRDVLAGKKLMPRIDRILEGAKKLPERKNF